MKIILILSKKIFTTPGRPEKGNWEGEMIRIKKSSIHFARLSRVRAGYSVMIPIIY